MPLEVYSPRIFQSDDIVKTAWLCGTQRSGAGFNIVAPTCFPAAQDGGGLRVCPTRCDCRPLNRRAASVVDTRRAQRAGSATRSFGPTGILRILRASPASVLGLSYGVGARSAGVSRARWRARGAIADPTSST